MKRIGIHTALLLCLYHSSVAAQEWKPISKQKAVEILKGVQEWYSHHPTYSVTVTHQLYDSFLSEAPLKIYPGYLFVNGNDYHSYLLNIETIQSGKFRTVIDSASKLIMVSNPNPEWMSLNRVSDSSILSRVLQCSTYQKGDNMVLRLSYSTGYPLLKYEVTMDKNYKILRVSFYYPTLSDDDQSGGMSVGQKAAKVVIRYDGYQSFFKQDALANHEEREIFNEDESKQLTTTELFSEYKLVDARINK